MKRRIYRTLDEGETVIGGSGDESTVFDSGGFLLTDRRVIHVDRNVLREKPGIRSIDLEKIDEIGFVNVKILTYIILAICIYALGLWINELCHSTDSIGILIILGAASVFVFGYFYTRKKVIQIFSSCGVMVLDVIKMPDEDIQKLIHEIDQARQRRIDQLSQTG